MVSLKAMPSTKPFKDESKLLNKKTEKSNQLYNESNIPKQNTPESKNSPTELKNKSRKLKSK